MDDTERMKLFYRVLLFIFPAFMAILVNASIFDSSCSKLLLPWTVFSIEDERMTLDRCFEVVVNKSATNIQEHIASGGHKLEEVRIGQTRDVLDRVGDTSKYKQKVFMYECMAIKNLDV